MVEYEQITEGAAIEPDLHPGGFERHVLSIARSPGPGWRGLRNRLRGGWGLSPDLPHRVNDLVTIRGATVTVLDHHPTFFRCAISGHPAAVWSAIAALMQYEPELAAEERS